MIQVIKPLLSGLVPALPSGYFCCLAFLGIYDWLRNEKIHGILFPELSVESYQLFVLKFKLHFHK